MSCEQVMTNAIISLHDTVLGELSTPCHACIPDQELYVTSGIPIMGLQILAYVPETALTIAASKRHIDHSLLVTLANQRVLQSAQSLCNTVHKPDISHACMVVQMVAPPVLL